MCFIDLRKAYDTVNRTLLWQVLTRIGVPPQMIAVIQQFHDGMRAYVRPNNSVCSDWFEVDQGPRQGCLLPPLLFNIFFAAVLTVVLQRFSEEPAILAELVHLKEPPTSVGPESAVDYVRRAVWGMLYADDACIVSRSPQGLAKMVEVMVEVCRAFALTVSANRTETMYMQPPRTTRTMVQVEAAEQTYKQVQSFTNLEGTVTEVPDRRCPLKSPDGPAHAGCASGGTYGGFTTNRKSRSPSRPEWLRWRQSRSSCMDVVRGPFARNTNHQGTAQETRPSDDFVHRAFEITGVRALKRCCARQDFCGRGSSSE